LSMTWWGSRTKSPNNNIQIINEFQSPMNKISNVSDIGILFLDII
jgi:hypothetical protein